MTSDKTLKKQLLRNNEYYDLQYVFDCLHEKAVKNYKFKDLMSLISSENNILLAYRNIKNNKGSKTKGTDGKTIAYYKNWSEENFIKYFQNKLSNYKPKSVRRVEIENEYTGKIRPLGIPCMDDRIIQQCIKQVLEPICEAKFHNHSYGFRPNRSTSHAIARANYLMWKNQLHYVVDVDIKGFFDNVNHAKLLKQMWDLGIQDKNLLCVIGKILKSEIKGIGMPEKGTPQGGIISPLLSNIVLNELDWWLSDQWETFDTRHKYTHWHKNRALKTTNMKEFYFVRYADDFKIFCRDYKTAQKIFSATKQWLLERLGLEISPEKSKITNVRKKATEFLGFTLKVKLKRKKYVTQSNITEKAKNTIKSKLKEQIKVIQKNTIPKEINKLNSIILGMHNYYKTATNVSLDFRDINFIVSKSLYNRLKDNLKKKRKKGVKNKDSPDLNRTYTKLYGQYKGKVKTIAGINIFPIYGIKHTSAMNFTQEINSYTEQGRTLIHNKLNNVDTLIKYLLMQKEYDKSTEYNDNRISLLAGQKGKCYITGLPLKIHEMECHHKKPKSKGGTDEYKNLVWVNENVHKLVHSTETETINKYLNKLELDTKAFKKLNSLRLSVGNLEIINVA